MLVLRDAKLGETPTGLERFGGVVQSTCVGPRAVALQMLDMSGNALSYDAAHIFSDAIDSGNGGAGLSGLHVLSVADNDLKDLGSSLVLDAVAGTAICGGTGGKSALAPLLLKLDMRSNAVLLTESLSVSIQRYVFVTHDILLFPSVL
jgi:hypothetical protein